MNHLANDYNWSSFPAIGWIVPVVAVIGGLTWLTLSAYWKYRLRASEGGGPNLRGALDANTEATRAVLAKLETLDQRLTAVEKTLTDIP